MSNTKSKTYPSVVEDSLKAISTYLRDKFTQGKYTYRTVSAMSKLSVNSVKSILTGETANIASYDMVARAVGTSLVTACAAIDAEEKRKETQAATAETPTQTTSPF